jgi:protease II
MRKTLASLVLMALGVSAAAAQQSPYSGLGTSSVPPEKIARYAPPALAPEVSRRIQAAYDLRSPGLGIVAPDGKRLYFTWSVTGSSQIWRLDAPKAYPIQMTGGEDTTAVSGMTPDGKWIVVTRDVGGQEDPGLYLQPAGGGPFKIIQKIEKVRTFFEGALEDSRTILFRSNDVKADSYAIYSYDLVTGQRTLLFGEPGLWGVADYRGSGSNLRLLLGKATGALSGEFYEYDVASKELTPLLGVGEKVEYEAAYAADPGELLVKTNKFSEYRRLYRWKIGSGSAAAGFTAVSPDLKMDVAGFRIDDARRYVYLEINDGGYTRLRVLDAKTYGPVELPLPGDADHVYAGAATRDGRFVTIGVETAKAPRTSFVWDWQTKSLTQWVVPSAPEADLSSFAVAKLMSYPARDGTPIPMFVRFPKGCSPEENKAADPCPVIVEFHGGPEGQATPGFSPRAQLFVDAGFVFVQPNVRGSDGYGKAWLDADNGAKRLDVITDIDDCGKWIRANWGRNGKPPRIGITGGSYGGYSTLVGMTMFAGTYDAGASVVGMSNLVTMLHNTAPYRRALRASEYGDPEKDSETLLKLSPITYIDRVKAPLLIIQGLNDPRVPAGEAVQIQEALEKKGTASKLILVPEEGHGSSRRSGQVIMTGNVLRFFEENLAGRKM